MPMRGYITIEDGEGNRSTMNLTRTEDAVLDTGAALDGVEAVAAAILPYIEGQIVDLGVAVTGTLPVGNPAVPDPDSNTQEKATFPFRVEGGFAGRLSVPTINKEAAFLDNSDLVTDAFQAAMSGALEGGGFSDERGAVIENVERGYQSYTSRKRRG